MLSTFGEEDFFGAGGSGSLKEKQSPQNPRGYQSSLLTVLVIVNTAFFLLYVASGLLQIVLIQIKQIHTNENKIRRKIKIKKE